MQPFFREEKLALVNEQARFDKVVLNRVNDLVEGHNYRFKIWLEKFQREIRGGFQSGNAYSLADKILGLHRFCRDDDWPVAFSKSRAAIEKDILVAQARISGEADGCDIVCFQKGRFVERLNVGENVRVLVTGCRELVGSQRIKHERIVGIRRMRQLDFNGRCFGLRGCWLADRKS